MCVLDNNSGAKQRRALNKAANEPFIYNENARLGTFANSIGTVRQLKDGKQTDDAFGAERSKRL